MKRITVNATGHYDVLIGSDLLSQVGCQLLTIHPACKAAIVSDSNVWPLYGDVVEKSLLTSGFEPVHYVFPAGEESKNAQTYLKILDFLSENEITRSDIVIALGGGVVGDITGFSAATFLRGIDYIQIPTSLLAMVDSSVGGKTAIDLQSGKNLVGAFKQPKLVLCDVSTLNSLPHPLFLDGCAEVIKYGVLYDKDFIAYLLDTGPEFDREVVITKCVALKSDVVENDEFDMGDRQKLNLGHTLGHGIEAGSNFQISHGKAVASGMAIVTKAAVHNQLCAQSVYDELCRLLQAFSLPTKTDFTAHELYTFALSDKKRSGKTVNLVIPRDFGRCDIIATPITELEPFIKAGIV